MNEEKSQDFHEVRTCTDMRRMVKKFLEDRQVSEMEKSKWWNLMSVTRGPDAPSGKEKESRSYWARCHRRKWETVEVLRHSMFWGTVGAGARHREGNCVILPPESEWDHFDAHVGKAAQILGLRIVIRCQEDSENQKG